jgi:hypothetical protein
MRQSQKQLVAGSSSQSWAAVLAKCRHMESDHMHSEECLTARDEAIALWVLFDEAVVAANAALEREGLVDRISVEGDELERVYSLVDASGRPREIKVAFAKGSEDNELSSAALLTFSTTRGRIRLVPRINGYKLRWLVASRATEFTPDLVHDLFLSVFGDDPLATFRLSPLAGAELFETPWS